MKNQETLNKILEEFRKTMLFTKAGSWLECSDYEGTVTEMKKFISSTYDTAYEKGVRDAMGLIGEDDRFDGYREFNANFTEDDMHWNMAEEGVVYRNNERKRLRLALSELLKK